jgi:hypothetical protein
MQGLRTDVSQQSSKNANEKKKQKKCCGSKDNG